MNHPPPAACQNLFPPHGISPSPPGTHAVPGRWGPGRKSYVSRNSYPFPTFPTPAPHLIPFFPGAICVVPQFSPAFPHFSSLCADVGGKPISARSGIFSSLLTAFCPPQYTVPVPSGDGAQPAVWAWAKVPRDAAAPAVPLCRYTSGGAEVG